MNSYTSITLNKTYVKYDQYVKLYINKYQTQ